MLTVLREKRVNGEVPQIVAAPSKSAAKGKLGKKLSRQKVKTMAAATETSKHRCGHKNEKVGEVVSDKMAKTIVVEVTRRVPHPVYKRIVRSARSFMRTTSRAAAQDGRCGADRGVPSAEPLEALAAWRVLRQGGAGRRRSSGSTEQRRYARKKTLKKKKTGQSE